VIPGSDGSGIVEAVGKRVTRFKTGDKVVTLFNQGHLAGSLDAQSLNSGLGGVVDGTLREYGAFDEHGLVHMPKNLNWLEGSTLSCAAVTAWNALYGLESKALKPGDTVLTQGTGGVSMFALQVCRLFYMNKIKSQTLTRWTISVCQSRRRNSNLHDFVQQESRNTQGTRRRSHRQLQRRRKLGRDSEEIHAKWRGRDAHHRSRRSNDHEAIPQRSQDRRRHIHHRLPRRHVQGPALIP
jgi:hypothetical protein